MTAPTSQPIASATNRGNKLQAGASTVHAGALPYPRGAYGHKQVSKPLFSYCQRTDILICYFSGSTMQASLDTF
jgi:hypothetical protein